MPEETVNDNRHNSNRRAFSSFDVGNTDKPTHFGRIADYQFPVAINVANVSQSDKADRVVNATFGRC